MDLWSTEVADGACNGCCHARVYKQCHEHGVLVSSPSALVFLLLGLVFNGPAFKMGSTHPPPHPATLSLLQSLGTCWRRTAGRRQRDEQPASASLHRSSPRPQPLKNALHFSHFNKGTKGTSGARKPRNHALSGTFLAAVWGFVGVFEGGSCFL